MKKALALLLCVSFLFLVGCGADTNTTSQTANSSSKDSSMNTETSVFENSSEETTTSANASSKEQTDSKVDVSSETTSTNTSSATTTKPVANPLVITCYGDSVTQGMSVDEDKNYPSVLQTLLGGNYKVQNAGIGGEKTTAIMARQGSLKIYTKAEITFEAGQTEVLIDKGASRGFVAEDGREPTWNDPFGRDVPISDITINGKAYKLSFRNFAWSKGGGPSTCDTYLVRTNADTAETIPGNSLATFTTSNTSKTNYADIYFMGFNGTYKDIDELISQYQKMVDYRNDDNYLIVIPFWEKLANKKAYTKFKETFGDHTVDLVEYCANGRLEKLGISLEKYDSGCLENEILPYSLKLYTISNRRDVHLNERGYKVLANAIFDQGKKINLW